MRKSVEIETLTDLSKPDDKKRNSTITGTNAEEI